MNNIGFNKPYITGNETKYILEAVSNRHISGNGYFTKQCHHFFKERYHFQKNLLTTSCTDALEMCAILLNVQPGDEVIVPSFTFVSTANAFILRGAKIVFADSYSTHPNMDVGNLESLITNNTKAIVAVHYAGVACDMDSILSLAQKYKLFVVEDAAQAIDSYYKNLPLGGLGHLSAFSFHETKNIISGEGGMVVVNDSNFEARADIIWEKGTNRKAFFNKEIEKYGWVDIGSSFLPSEIIAAFLFAQLEKLDFIQEKRKALWNYYNQNLKRLEKKGVLKLPVIPSYATNNAHMFYITCENQNVRDGLIEHLSNQNINAVFHYLSLHASPFFKEKHDGRLLPWSDYYSNSLVRLPFYNELTSNDQDRVIGAITSFFQ